jgi:hypothetical protein
VRKLTTSKCTREKVLPVSVVVAPFADEDEQALFSQMKTNRLTQGCRYGRNLSKREESDPFADGAVRFSFNRQI